jgi:hypothetical protein
MSGTRARQADKGFASIQNGVMMPPGTGLSNFMGRSSRCPSTTTVYLSASGAPIAERYSFGIMNLRTSGTCSLRGGRAVAMTGAREIFSSGAGAVAGPGADDGAGAGAGASWPCASAAAPSASTSAAVITDPANANPACFNGPPAPSIATHGHIPRFLSDDNVNTIAAARKYDLGVRSRSTRRAVPIPRQRRRTPPLPAMAARRPAPRARTDAPAGSPRPRRLTIRQRARSCR